MANHITSAEVNLHSGLLRATISFQPGLNLIAGENGTFKTKLLNFLKVEQAVQLSDPGSPRRCQAISPKRNAVRRGAREILAQYRRDNTTLDSLLNERNISDATSEEYPALGGLYYVVYQEHCKDGGDQSEKMNRAVDEFNSVIGAIFPQYRLDAQWNALTGGPVIELLKSPNQRIPIEGLSLGEQEILSLATNIYSSRGRYDIFLIDEPEAHLNWHLEERLFEWFDSYARTYDKQLIVVTHSRAIFKEPFLSKTQFLFWNDQGTITVSPNISGEHRRKIAGDAIHMLQLGEFSRPTIFVEDVRTKDIVEALASSLSSDITVTECGDKSAVRSIYNRSRSDGGWPRSFFLEDGDGQGNPYPNSPEFIHLEKYCIENYLLDLGVMAGVCGETEAACRRHVFSAIQDRKGSILRKNKFFEFLMDLFAEEHLNDARLSLLDASEIFEALLLRINMSFDHYVENYIRVCKEQERLGDVFPERLFAALESNIVQSGPGTVSATP